MIGTVLRFENGPVHRATLPRNERKYVSLFGVLFPQNRPLDTIDAANDLHGFFDDVSTWLHRIDVFAWVTKVALMKFPGESVGHR